MPRTEDPTITIRTGIVAAAYPGATSEQVEKQVAKTLEAHIFKYQEVRKDKTYSTSRQGLCIINVELEKNVKNPDVFWAKLRHELNVVKATSLPPQVMGPVVDSDFGDTVAMLIMVTGERYGYRELKDYADKIQDTLRTVPAVGKIAVYGNQTEQIWITSSPERMSQYFTDPRAVMAALAQRNAVLGSGSVRTDKEQIPFHTTALFNTEDEIRKVMVGKSPTGQPSYIGDFAQVERRYQDPEFRVRYDGKPALMISVEMQKGNNIIQMGNRVTEALERLRPLLPPDLKMDYIANQPKVVEERMSDLGREFVTAIACVILVTLILLPMRVALIAALAIPTTMLTTVGVMNVIGHAAAPGVHRRPDPGAGHRGGRRHRHRRQLRGASGPQGADPGGGLEGPGGSAGAGAGGHPHHHRLVPAPVDHLRVVGRVHHGAAHHRGGGALGVLPGGGVPHPPDLPPFIHKGLHDPNAAAPADGHKHKRSVLDLLQAGYNKAIVFFMSWPALAVGLGIGAIVAGVLLFFRFVPQLFFPRPSATSS